MHGFWVLGKSNAVGLVSHKLKEKGRIGVRNENRRRGIENDCTQRMRKNRNQFTELCDIFSLELLRAYRAVAPIIRNDASDGCSREIVC